MIKIKLIGINELDETYFLEYLQAWTTAGESVAPSACLLEGTFTEWKAKQEDILRANSTPEGIVRAETRFLTEDNGYVLGAVNLRYALTEDLLRYGGHLSFGVRPDARKKGYAFIMLKLTFNVLRVHGITRALITSRRDNKAARSVIKKIGGQLENSYEQDGDVIDRYWISL